MTEIKVSAPDAVSPIDSAPQQRADLETGALRETTFEARQLGSWRPSG
jgi:hypothetical protein